MVIILHHIAINLKHWAKNAKKNWKGINKQKQKVRLDSCSMIIETKKRFIIINSNHSRLNQLKNIQFTRRVPRVMTELLITTNILSYKGKQSKNHNSKPICNLKLLANNAIQEKTGEVSTSQWWKEAGQYCLYEFLEEDRVRVSLLWKRRQKVTR